MLRSRELAWYTVQELQDRYETLMRWDDLRAKTLGECEYLPSIYGPSPIESGDHDFDCINAVLSELDTRA